MLIEGPFESDYSLAIVNRRLALALMHAGQSVRWHQRDNTTYYPPSPAFLAANPELAACFAASVNECFEQVHSRNIYPPFTDGMIGAVRAFHCYAWEESVFPKQYINAFNRDLDIVTVSSAYVRDVLINNGLTIPVEVIGEGADHIIENPPQFAPCFDPDTFHFVHVSSCFPRKGADVLVEAFCREFSRREDVCLIIKTFPNPHNEIEELIAKAKSRYPLHAPIKLILDPFSPGQMRYLIEESECLVAPSRGEGFGLPVAEAMLLGTPVIATIHGGHADLCSPEWCWPVDFRLAPAHTHLTEGHSLWAEPDPASLSEQMRATYEGSQNALQLKTTRARKHILSRFTWAQAAKRHDMACSRVFLDRRSVKRHFTSSPRNRIGFITTWNVRCGIAEYTRYLSTSLSPDYDFSVFANRVSEPVRADEQNVQRCWTVGKDDLPDAELDDLTNRICAAECEAISIQHAFSLFSPGTVRGILSRLKRRGIGVAVTLHGTKGEKYDLLVAALRDADAVIVHGEEDRERLVNSGLTQVKLLRHGIYVPEDLQGSSRASAGADLFEVSCFGFFLPPKGIYELLQAFAAAAQINGALRLKLLNSLYNAPESYSYAAECMRFIRQHNISDRVLICTEFLDHDVIMAELVVSDLVVCPYTHSSESASGAIRQPLASLTPVLCSDLPLFDEFDGIVHRYPAHDTIALANRLIELSTNPQLLRKFEAKQKEYVDELSWRKVARDFGRMMIASCTSHRSAFAYS